MHGRTCLIHKIREENSIEVVRIYRIKVFISSTSSIFTLVLVVQENRDSHAYKRFILR